MPDPLPARTLRAVPARPCRVLAGLLLVLASLGAPPASSRARAAGGGEAAEPWDYHPRLRKALAARDAGDTEAFRKNMEAAVRIAPGHPGLLYYLAVADARAGKREQSLDCLRRIAAMGMIYPAAEEPAFEALRSAKKFRSILERFQANGAPVSGASPSFTVPEKDFIAEGLAYDPSSDRFFVGSVRKRKIVSVARDGTVRDFSRPGDGLWGVFGMKVDAPRRALWVASSATPEMEGYRKEDQGSAGIFRYDLGTGKLLRKYLLKDPGGRHVIGDLAVGAGGDVYATDSLFPTLYRVRRGGLRLEPFLRHGPFLSLQGIDFSRDGKSLYVADYSRGIFRVDLSRPEPVLLAHGKDQVLLGIDGLYARGDSLLAVQNGTRPNRVVRLSLDPSGTAVAALRVLEAGSPGFDGPTLGVVAGKAFYFIANSEWDAFETNPSAPDPDRLREPVIFKLPL